MRAPNQVQFKSGQKFLSCFVEVLIENCEESDSVTIETEGENCVEDGSLFPLETETEICEKRDYQPANFPVRVSVDLSKLPTPSVILHKRSWIQDSWLSLYSMLQSMIIRLT